jgi:hypothetical protein
VSAGGGEVPFQQVHVDTGGVVKVLEHGADFSGIEFNGHRHPSLSETIVLYAQFLSTNFYVRKIVQKTRKKLPFIPQGDLIEYE